MKSAKRVWFAILVSKIREIIVILITNASLGAVIRRPKHVLKILNYVISLAYKMLIVMKIVHQRQVEQKVKCHVVAMVIAHNNKFVKQ